MKKNNPIALPSLDAVVGNPPYGRQEKVDKRDKARFGQISSDAWPGLRLTGRADLHCCFWPEQRARSDRKRFSAYDLAADTWDAADLEDATPLGEWLGRQSDCDAMVIIHDERPAVLIHDPLLGDHVTTQCSLARRVDLALSAIRCHRQR